MESAAKEFVGQAETEVVSEEWRDIGFSGQFSAVATIEPPESVDQWIERVPCMVPLGTNSGWLANRVIPGDEPKIVLVRKDENAIMDIAHGRIRG